MPVNPRTRDPALPRRRQNNSCDQCRDGKRRCDVQVRTDHFELANGTVSSKSGPCTNCKRWKKRCTVEWIRSREKRSRINPPQRQQAQFDDTLMYSSLEDLQNRPNWSQVDLHQLPDEHLVDANVLQAFSDCYAESEELLLQSASVVFDENTTKDAVDTGQSWPLGSGLDVVDTGSVESVQSWAGMNNSESNSCRSEGLDGTINAQTFDWRPLHNSSVGHSEFEQSVCDTSSTRYPRRSDCSDSFTARPRSPFSSQLLADDFNRLSIKKTLLKIYHDSMEGALSCWLTERNCPYSSQVFDGREVWSPNWANRIVTRVCDLDKAYSNTGKLSSADQAQASRVLGLVVMAFAAQWSQTGERSCFRLSMSSRSPLTPLSTAEDDVFGRNMQKNLWHQASKALLTASDNKSFRVIFAGIIFSLAQRPVDITDILQDQEVDLESSFASLNKILDLDGAPICLDVALRKLLDHQRSMYNATRGYAMTDVHKETFGLLCWLAVMFDTLSAAVNRRAFTICDQDSSFESLQNHLISSQVSARPDVNLTEDYAGMTDASSIWGDYFLRQMSRAGDIRKEQTRWPCSYDNAASCLADAAPVKVLLFRRVAHLQNLSYQRAPGSTIETALDAVMQVYVHWNNTYGRFINDCIAHHEELPARIQSWYILLAGHWNLAILILADVLSRLDDQRRTLLSQRRSREAIKFTHTLRTQAAFAMSDLGRCSRYGDESLTFMQSPDFHHAVNKAALLTEPWTAVLIRAFGYAGAFLAKQMRPQTEPNPLMDTIGVSMRLQYCIDALWLLGKKSDTALCAAQVLCQYVH